MAIASQSTKASADHVDPAGEHLSEPELRELVEKMRERERRVMKLINATTPERIEHDLRNVLNELVLLRTLFDPKNGD